MKGFIWNSNFSIYLNGKSKKHIFKSQQKALQQLCGLEPFKVKITTSHTHTYSGFTFKQQQRINSTYILYNSFNVLRDISQVWISTAQPRQLGLSPPSAAENSQEVLIHSKVGSGCWQWNAPSNPHQIVTQRRRKNYVDYLAGAVWASICRFYSMLKTHVANSTSHELRRRNLT